MSALAVAWLPLPAACPRVLSPHGKNMTCLQVSGLLSPSGKFFLVTVADNDPEDILRGLLAHGLAGAPDLFESMLAAKTACCVQEGCLQVRRPGSASEERG